MTIARFVQFLFPALLIIAAVTSCNPVGISAPDSLCTGMHPKNIMDICHGGSYRSPYGRCDEANCHGNTLTGGNTGAPSCFRCHSDLWHHTQNFNGHYHYYTVCTGGNFTTMCGNTTCHGDLTTPKSGKGPNCTSCHTSGVPSGCVMRLHTVSKDGHLHYKTVCSGGDFTKICGTAACHGDTLNGGNGPRCATSGCHGSTPKNCD
jgi:hypothetical protein